MKITDVRTVQPIASNSPPDWRTHLGQILVAVDTDVGLTGYGVGGGGPAGMHVIRTVLRDLLLGRSPEPVEALWDTLYRATLPFGRKGLAIMALSGVDLALWDLRGKAAGLPVAVLLGGTPETVVPMYATVWDAGAPELREPYPAFKLHLGKLDNPQDRGAVLRQTERVRAEIGPARSLMLDAWMQWDVESTLELAGHFATLGVEWIEEPLPLDDTAGYEKLADRCPIPIAGGEHEFTAAGFGEIIERRWHSILQPDACWCGGMTEMVKIYRMATEAGLRVCPHRGAEPWGLHAIVGLDRNPLAESGRPWMTWVGGQVPPVEGRVRIRDAPGFGVEIDEADLPLP